MPKMNVGLKSVGRKIVLGTRHYEVDKYGYISCDPEDVEKFKAAGMTEKFAVSSEKEEVKEIDIIVKEEAKVEEVEVEVKIEETKEEVKEEVKVEPKKKSYQRRSSGSTKK